MKLNTVSFFKGFSITAIVVLVIHLLVYRALNIGINLYLLFEIYIFLIALTIGHFFVLQWLFKKWPKFAGLLFTALSFVKMGLCILYLFPYIFPSNDQSIGIALNFMAVYFMLLFFDVYFLVKNLFKNQ